MSELLLASTDIRDRTGIFLDLMSGFYEPPNLRGVDTVVPTLPGRIPRVRVPDTRTIILAGYVTGSDAGDWATNTAALMALLDGSEQTLTVDDDYLGTSSAYTITVRCLTPPMGGSPDYGVLYQSWNIELVSVTPDWATSP